MPTKRITVWLARDSDGKAAMFPHPPIWSHDSGLWSGWRRAVPRELKEVTATVPKGECRQTVWEIEDEPR